MLSQLRELLSLGCVAVSWLLPVTWDGKSPVCVWPDFPAGVIFPLFPSLLLGVTSNGKWKLVPAVSSHQLCAGLGAQGSPEFRARVSPLSAA